MAYPTKNDEFLIGVLSALGCVYICGEESVAEEIVKTVGGNALLRVARREEDCFLPDLRKTVREVKRLRSIGM